MALPPPRYFFSVGHVGDGTPEKGQGSWTAAIRLRRGENKSSEVAESSQGLPGLSIGDAGRHSSLKKKHGQRAGRWKLRRKPARLAGRRGHLYLIDGNLLPDSWRRPRKGLGNSFRGWGSKSGAQAEAKP